MSLLKNYIGIDKAINDALVSSRGQPTSDEERIAALERQLETRKLSQSEIADIQKKIKQIRGSVRR